LGSQTSRTASLTVGQVVDVLTGGGEVGEFADVVEAQRPEATANEVLDGLHVMPGRGFQDRQFIDLGLAEIGHQGAKGGLLLDRERHGTEQAAVGERDEPFHLDLNTGTVEAGL
jgi:hypothetical protein